MKLKEFIEAKQKELEAEYREVKFYTALDVQLVKNGCAEAFTAEFTPLDKEVREVNLSDLESSSTVPHTPNGTRVTFKVKLPRKRTFTDKEFHVLWIEKVVEPDISEYDLFTYTAERYKAAKERLDKGLESQKDIKNKY